MQAYGRQGYRVVETSSKGSDGGVDLILHGNGEKVLVQCKQWRNFKVGVKDIREFNGVLMSRNTTANRGIFVTMGNFTQESIKFAQENSMELIDGDKLLLMMKDVQSHKTHAVDSCKTPVVQEPDVFPAAEHSDV
ncbi:MAG: restriction endonuclease [Armatimonadota bacterium]